MFDAWFLATLILFIYVFITLAIGFYAAKVSRRGMEDFYVLSRRAGLLVTFLATASTYHSAFAFLASVSTYVNTGITFWIGSSAWTTLAGVTGYLIGKRIWALGKRKGYISPADLLVGEFNSKTLGFVASVMWLIFITCYIVVQAVGLGIILDVASGGRIPYDVASLLLVMATAIYVAIGGLRAAYWTDVLQGIWMYIGVWLAGTIIMYKFFPGGLPQVLEAIRANGLSKLLTLNWDPLTLYGNIMVFGVGLMILPHLWIKYYAARDSWTLKWSSLLTAIYLSSYYIPAMFAGLTAAVLNVTGVPGALNKGFVEELTKRYGSPDAVMAYMIYLFTHPVVAGFLLAGAAAAAMSTLDSFLGAASLIVTRDIIQRLKPGVDEQKLVVASKVAILLFALVGWAIAIQRPGLIFDLAAVACGGGLQVLPMLIQIVSGSSKKIINRYGALAGLLAGCLTVLLLSSPTAKYFGVPKQFTFTVGQASLYGLAINILLSIAISLVFRESGRR